MRKALGTLFILSGSALLLFWFYQTQIDPGGAISASEAMPALPAGALLFLSGLVAALGGARAAVPGAPNGPPAGGSRVGVGIAALLTLACAWQLFFWFRGFLFIGMEPFVVIRVALYGIGTLGFGGLAMFLRARGQAAVQGPSAPTP